MSMDDAVPQMLTRTELVAILRKTGCNGGDLVEELTSKFLIDDDELDADTFFRVILSDRQIRSLELAIGTANALNRGWLARAREAIHPESGSNDAEHDALVEAIDAAAAWASPSNLEGALNALHNGEIVR